MNVNGLLSGIVVGCVLYYVFFKVSWRHLNPRSDVDKASAKNALSMCYLYKDVVTNYVDVDVSASDTLNELAKRIEAHQEETGADLSDLLELIKEHKQRKQKPLSIVVDSLQKIQKLAKHSRF